MPELSWEWWVILIYGGVVLLQVLHHCFFYLQLVFHKDSSASDEVADPVSLIVCARNEVENLKELIPLLLAQDHPSFEVIIVDDQSDDETIEYLYHLTREEPKVRMVKVGDVRKPMAGKKFPLTLGLKAATHDTVLLTDADCRPSSSGWLKAMMAGYGPNTSIVLGFSPYEERSGFLNKVIRYETFYAAQNYLSYACAGMPYMGVGRNLSYRKELFFSNGGFTRHRELPSGDDDLFVNGVARRKNTAVVIKPESQVYSFPKESWEDWIDQKKRHISTARFYRPLHKCMLGMNSTLQLLVYVLLLPALLFSPLPFYWVLGAFLFRWLVNRIIFQLNMNKLKVGGLSGYIELFDSLQVFYYFRFMRAAMVKTKYRWN